ncbi:hypothetical protein F190043G2_02140 [Blautia caecimuris]
MNSAIRSLEVFQLFIIATNIGENTADKARAMERIIDNLDMYKPPFFKLGAATPVLKE